MVSQIALCIAWYDFNENICISWCDCLDNIMHSWYNFLDNIKHRFVLIFLVTLCIVWYDFHDNIVYRLGFFSLIKLGISFDFPDNFVHHFVRLPESNYASFGLISLITLCIVRFDFLKVGLLPSKNFYYYLLQ